MKLLLRPLLAGMLLLQRAAHAQPDEISINHRTFADALTSELYANDNECTSSWGVSLAFSLVYPSSVNTTRDQIQTVFGYPANETHLQLVWNDTATRIDAAYEGACRQESSFGECFEEEPTLEIANSIWVDDAFQLDPAYEAVVQDFVFQIDFDNSTAGSTVNEWVNASTRGLIDSIVPEGSLSGIALLAINSIYLKASWWKQFSKGATNKDVFYSSASRVTPRDSEAHFMHQVDEFLYSHEAVPGYQIIQLGFVGDLSMLFVLPMTETSDDVSSSDLIGALPQLTTTRVALALPKFKFSSEYNDNLKSSLQALGLTAPFEGGLCVFVNECSRVSKIIQKTFIDVNEEGVEAAAVTAIIVTTSGPPEDPPDPVLFLADHPFQFFIYDSVEELVIFEGRVGDPGIPEGAAEPELQASHSDTDFWQTYFGVDPNLAPDSTGQQSTPRPTSITPAEEPTPLPTPDPTGEPSSSASSVMQAGIMAGLAALIALQLSLF